MTARVDAAGRRWLVPREHGAYAQLGCPLFAALLAGTPTTSALSLAAAAVALFVAHEPASILLGRRGTRALREDGRRARVWLASLVTVGLAAGCLGVWLAPDGAGVAVAAAVVAALGVLVAVAVVLGAEKTGGGEALAVAALTGCGLPVALANGAATTVAVGAWGAWVSGLVATTFAVRRALSRAPDRTSWARPIILCCSLAALAGAIGMGAPWAAALPLLLASWALTFVPVAPKRVRSVGWMLVGASVSTTLLTVTLSYIA